METLSLFLLKSIVVSGLLTAWYLLGLRDTRLHKYNRFFLLTTMFASLTVPFFHFQLFTISRTIAGSLAPVALFIQPAGDAGNTLPVVQAAQPQLHWQAIIAIIAAGVSLTLLIILSTRIFKVLMMRTQYTVARYEGINLVLTDSPRAPFTFLKYVFWNKELPLQDEIGQLIFKHELTHIEQGHTYDKLACQVLTCIFWFNPFYWIIQKELNIVHEFVADEHAVNNRDTEAFAMMLLRSYNNGSYLVPQHYFFSSTTRRRLAMLQNGATPSYASLRRVMVIPLITAAIILFSFGCRNRAAGDIAPAKKKIIVLLDAGHGGPDVGAHSGGYMEKDICLKYARRIKELSTAYNVDVQLTRSDDQYMALPNRVAISDKVQPDVFISLHINDEPGKEKEKGDFDIYISGENPQAKESSNYSSAIFLAMAQDGIIPGVSDTSGHGHPVGCACDACIHAASENAKISALGKESYYVLKHARVPVLVMLLGNIKDQEEMQQLTDNSRTDALCNAILKGIVDGATEKDGIAGNTLSTLLGQPGGKTCR